MKLVETEPPSNQLLCSEKIAVQFIQVKLKIYYIQTLFNCRNNVLVIQDANSFQAQFGHVLHNNITIKNVVFK